MGSGDYLVHLRCAVGSERGRFLQSALPGHDREGDNFARTCGVGVRSRKWRYQRLRRRSGACRRLPCSRNDTRKDRKSLRGRWNRRAPTSTDYVFGGSGNPGGGFPHWGVGTPYISDRRKAALTSPRRLVQWSHRGTRSLLAPTINQADTVRRTNPARLDAGADLAMVGAAGGTLLNRAS